MVHAQGRAKVYLSLTRALLVFILLTQAAVVGRLFLGLVISEFFNEKHINGNGNGNGDV